MKRSYKRNPYFLDVAEYIITGPFSPKPSPVIHPVEMEYSENHTPLNLPLFVEVEKGVPSPYLKELLGNNHEIEFFDFTLDGSEVKLSKIQDDYQEEEADNDQYYDQQVVDEKMSVIVQQQQPEDEHTVKSNQFEFNPEQYVPNMHLLELDPVNLRISYFQSIIQKYSKQCVSEEQVKEFVMLYLTDEDLEKHKEIDLKSMINLATKNLAYCGTISMLQRKSKVTKYLQKKKKRIYRKKINYDCRKKVADNRLRVKGKFVTKQQACTMLGIQECSQQQLKSLLNTKYSKMIF